MSKPNQNASGDADAFQFEPLQMAKNYRQALIDRFAPFLRGRVLEVGAGVGQLTSSLAQHPSVTHLHAVEPDTRFLPYLQQVLPTTQITFGTANDVDAEQGWDCIVNVNVLEHIEDDLAELRRYRELLASNKGHVCLFVPARMEIYAPLDADFGHFRRYTSRTLREKLTQAGFEIIDLRYAGFIGYFAWWFSFKLLRRRGFTNGAVRFFDRVIFPPMNWIETRVCPPPFGQSMVAIARAI